ncbi:hypothetical protein QJQ45_016484 [Haematococcus lacustris]|nr:hypothetical protein QJQ45_016484 [Haematococcus lacustris]
MKLQPKFHVTLTMRSSLTWAVVITRRENQLPVSVIEAGCCACVVRPKLYIPMDTIPENGQGAATRRGQHPDVQLADVGIAGAEGMPEDWRRSAAEAEARREEDIRMQRLMASARIHSGEAQGISGPAVIPEVMAGAAGDGTERTGIYRSMLYGGPSLDNLVAAEQQAGEGRGSPTLDLDQQDAAADRQDHRAGPAQHAPPPMAPSAFANVGYAAQQSMLQAPGSHSPGNGPGNGSALGHAGQHPSERLGQSLSVGSKERQQLAALTAARASGTHAHGGRAEESAVKINMGSAGGVHSREASQSGQGSVGGEVESKQAQQSKQLLASLPKEQQMVLAFTGISSWVSGSSFGPKPAGVNAKGPLAKLNLSNLAGSCLKPFKTAGEGLRKRTAASTKGKAADDVEMGKAAATGGKAPTQTGPGNLSPVAAAARAAGERQILHAVTGHVMPGQVLALMGPSGSGKTSLLSVLGGRSPRAIKLEGNILINGERMSKAMRRRIGFVLQDDVLYETLTVLETLTYAGLLRLPNAMSRADKRARVDAVIEVLGLSKSRDTIIGGYFRRGVSGGERKRVSVGHELLINPAVLMLDEPTSGLDSTTALHLVTLLRDLASGGRAILTTIHQPSSRLYRQLDQVMLLAEGHIMYYGDALRAVDWFDHLGFSLPYGTNLADHILDCALGEVTHDPSAPGAAQAAASCGVNAHTSEQEDVQANRRQQYVNKMRGPVAVRALYTTYESWYLGHRGGFTVSMDELEEGGEGSLHGVKAAGRGGGPGGRPGGSGAPEVPNQRGCSRGHAGGGATGGAAAVATDLRDIGSGCAAWCSWDWGYKATQVGDAATDLCPGGPLPDSPSPPTAALPPSKASPLPLSHPLPKTISATSEAGGKAGGAGGAGLVRDGAPFWQQVAVLWQRAVKVRRFESLSGQNLVQMFLVAAITGLLWWQRGRNGDVAGAADILGLLFFELLFPSFRTLFASLFTFPDEFRMLTKERPSGMYKLSAYYIARTGADLPIEILYPTLFVVVVYWFGGLRPEAGAFFGNWLSMLLVVLVAQGWGLLIGGLFMVPKTAQTVTTVIMLSLMLVGGYYVRDVPVWIRWLRYLSFIYWELVLCICVHTLKRTIPSPAQPSPAQPSPAQPSPAQPSPAQPSPAQPSPAQPSPAQPSPAQPSPAQPSPAQPSPAQPSPAQPSPAQPSPAQPSPAQPSPAQPSPAQPSPAQPSPAQPSPAQPSPAQPSPAQPSPAQPSPAQPSPAQPSPAQPSPAQPSPAQPTPAHTRIVTWWQSNNLLTKIQFRHTSLTDCSQLGPNGGCLVVTDLQSALRLTADPNEAVYPEVLVLLAMLIILSVEAPQAAMGRGPPTSCCAGRQPAASATFRDLSLGLTFEWGLMGLAVYPGGLQAIFVDSWTMRLCPHAQFCANGWRGQPFQVQWPIALHQLGEQRVQRQKQQFLVARNRGLRTAASHVCKSASMVLDPADVVPDAEDSDDEDDRPKLCVIPSATWVAVIGGGVTGLMAAMYMARRGYQVDIYERKPHPAARPAGSELDYPILLSSRLVPGQALLALKELGVSTSFNRAHCAPFRGTWHISAPPAGVSAGHVSTTASRAPQASAQLHSVKGAEELYLRSALVGQQQLEQELAAEARRLFPHRLRINYGAEFKAVDLQAKVASIQLQQSLAAKIVLIIVIRGSSSSSSSSGNLAGSVSCCAEAAWHRVGYHLLLGADGAESCVRQAMEATRPKVRDFEVQRPLRETGQLKHFSGLPQVPSSGEVVPSMAAHQPGEYQYSFQAASAPHLTMWISQPGQVSGVVTSSQPISWEQEQLRHELLAAYGAALPQEWLQAILDQVAGASAPPPVSPPAAVSCSQYHGPGVVLLGDAAHAMTSSLGQGASCAIEGVRMLNLVLKVSGDAVDKAPAMFTQVAGLRAEDTQCMQQLEAFQRSLQPGVRHSDPWFALAGWVGAAVWRSAMLALHVAHALMPNSGWNGLTCVPAPLHRRFPATFLEDRLADARKGYSDTLKVMARIAAVPILAVLALVAVLMRGALANVRWSALVFGLGGA